MTKEQSAVTSALAREISGLVRESLFTLAGWGCTIAASIVAFRLTEGASCHPFATGLLVSSSTLFILMSAFELFWRLFFTIEPLRRGLVE